MFNDFSSSTLEVASLHPAKEFGSLPDPEILLFDKTKQINAAHPRDDYRQIER